MSLHGERWLIGGILGSLGMQGRYLVHRECRGDTDWTYRKIHLRFSASRESDYTGKRITFILTMNSFELTRLMFKIHKI